RILGPESITSFPPMDEGLEESSPRRFVYDARDLVISGYMYLSGTIQKKHPDEELYLWNPSTKKWDWVGKPYSETETSATYNVRLKRGGLFAVLRDRRSPVIYPALAWQRPEDNLLNETSDKAGESVILREYEIYDQESWVDRNTTAVYLDGVPIPFEWAGDRSLLRVRVAEKWIAPEGSFLSIDVADLAGNPATTYFDVIERD
ncbi:MAG: hypothetical protein KDK33_20530, partial [Leptospiraceae bacterium]|nr:hypothetical protein [Leptospiraceae bacterium]